MAKRTPKGNQETRSGSRPAVNNGMGQTFRGAQASINRNASALARDRNRDYRGLDKAVDRLYGNLLSSQKGARQNMTEANARDLRLIGRRLQLSRAANRRTSQVLGKEMAGRGDVMGMLANRNAGLQRGVDRDIAIGNANAQAAKTQAKRTAKTAQGVANIFEAGAKEQHAAAETMAAEALSTRTSEDTALIAQQEHELAMAKIQYERDLAMLEKQAEMERKQLLWQEKRAEKVLGSQTYDAIRPQVGALSQIVPAILDMEGASVDEIVQDILAGGFGLTPEDEPFIRSLALQLTTDTQKGRDTDHLAAEVFSAMSAIPGWSSMSDKQRREIRALLAKRFSAENTRRALDSASTGDPAADPGLDLSGKLGTYSYPEFIADQARGPLAVGQGIAGGLGGLIDWLK